MFAFLRHLHPSSKPSFAERSKAFAMMSLKEEYAHADLTGVSDENLKILDDW